MSEMNPNSDFEGKVRKALDVPDAAPEFVNNLRVELARRPVKMKSRFVFKPAWAIAFAIVVFALIAATPGAVNALKKLFGYVPGVGLVENAGGLRMLAEPVSVTREGVTLTITNAFVYADHVELIYEVHGIEPANDGTLAEDAPANQTAFCGGVNIGEGPIKDGDALLRLPDGTLLERDSTGKYPQNIFAMKPVYDAVIPADVNEMTLVLKCIPWARLGVVPENWEVPFKLVTVPAGTVVGEPVIEVTQSVEEEPVPSLTTPAPTPEVKMTLERIVPMESAMVFYLNFDMVNRDPSLISIMPVSAHVVDSLGQQIPLRGSFVWQPFEHQVGSSFEFVSESKPADGLLTIVVDQTRAYYMPLYTDPPQATSEQLSFTFDAGEDPQHGQKWILNKMLTIAGYEFEIVTAEAVTFSDIETPSYIDGSQGYDHGYQFAIESDPSLGLSVEMDISADTCWLYDVKKIEPSPLLYTQLCRDGYPKGPITVTVRELSVTSEEDLQVEWAP